MRRRRHQKNPLLMRIIVISIVVHLFALPILAKLGAFKKIQQHFLEAQLVKLPPPEREKEKPAVKQKHAPPKPAQTAKKSTTTASHRQGKVRTNVNQPRVAIANVPGGDGTGGTVEQGSGKQGVLPTQKTDTTPPTVKATEPPVQPKTNTSPSVEAQPTTKPTQPVVKTGPTQPVVKPEPPREPVFTAAQPLGGADSQPKPQIPDDLRTEALDKTCVAEFTVGPDGAPTNVKITQSTGNNELDRLALDAARKWKFKPATRDGQPIQSQVRLHVEFQVS
jgi:protein TonB